MIYLLRCSECGAEIEVPKAGIGVYYHEHGEQKYDFEFVGWMESGVIH